MANDKASAAAPAAPFTQKARMHILRLSLKKMSKATGARDAENVQFDASAEDLLPVSINGDTNAVRRLVPSAISDCKYGAPVCNSPPSPCIDEEWAINSSKPHRPENVQGRAVAPLCCYRATAQAAGYKLKAMPTSFPSDVSGRNFASIGQLSVAESGQHADRSGGRHAPLRPVVSKLAGALLVLVVAAAPLRAQEALEHALRPIPRPADLVIAFDGLDAETLDQLVAPIALYPDSVIAQILVASTFPLDVVKAERWLQQNVELEDEARIRAAKTEQWDPSIQVLAGAFPTEIERMAKDLDGTERLGEAVLAQTDDVLDAIQRMRTRAEAAGNLASNDYQTVSTQDESIVIEPADPGVIYVPTYDPALAYTAPVTPATVVAEDTSSLLTTGVVAFGTALLVDEIFDDDDDWDDYWYGPPVFDWDDGDFYPRWEAEVDREVNIENIEIDRYSRIGDIERPRERLGAWEPSPQQRSEARARISARQPGGGEAGVLGVLAARSGSGAREALAAAGARRQPGESLRLNDSALNARPEGLRGTRAAGSRDRASLERQARPVQAHVQRPLRSSGISAPRQKQVVSRSAAARRPTALSRPSSGARAHAASSRGHGSVRGSGGGRGGGREFGGRRR